MTTWLKKPFTDGAYESDQVRFSSLFVSMGGPREMMMVCRNAGGAKVDVYIGVPSESIAMLFPGFEKIAESSLPTEAIILVADQSAFEERFKFPQR